MARHAEVCWIFSLARCGSSVAAYGAAAPWSVPVADEVFGPWDRTGPPYNYPPEQEELRKLYWSVGEHLTPEVVDLASRVFDKIAGASGRVVMKHPHDSIRPEEFEVALKDHRHVFLLRNPLLRLNSLYARGWFKAISADHDLHRFKLVARRWLASPHRLRYEDLRKDPGGFFRRIWDAWGWRYTDADVEKALEYQRSHYHDSSAKLSKERPDEVVSEKKFALPEGAAELYLNDGFVRELMTEAGWSTDPDSYR